MMKQEQKKKNTPLSLHKADHDPRAAALVALSQVLAGQIDSQQAVDDALQSASLVPTNKRLCTELVYGVLRQYIRLSWFTCRYLSKPEKLPAEMLLVLIMALYEMTFLRIPHHASVGWAVSHVRNRFGIGLSRVANGTLRTLQRRLRDFHDERLYVDSFPTETAALACRYAMPEWIVQHWLNTYGKEEALQLLEAGLQTPPSGLRLNAHNANWQSIRDELLMAEVPVKRQAKHLVRYAAEKQQCTANTAAVTDDADCLAGKKNAAATDEAEASCIRVHCIEPCGLAIDGSLPWQARGYIKEGKASRQSAASYEILQAFCPHEWVQPVWDCCAGRGGKTLALLEAGIPVAVMSDPSASRLVGFSDEYSRLQLSEEKQPLCIVASAVDLYDRLAAGDVNDSAGTPVNSLPEQFGTVVVDAPCSGFGTLARRPEVRLRRTEADIAQLTTLQRSILDAVASKVAAGGSLIYMTCTRTFSENQGQVAAFLQEHQDFHLVQEFETPASSLLREFFYGARLVRQK